MGVQPLCRGVLWILLKGRYKRMTLWNHILLEKGNRSPHRRMYKKPNPIQRASLCICLKGSYTLEAAVVIPIVAAYIVTLLSFFQIFEIQRAVDEALLYAGRKTAVESSAVDSEELLFLSAETYLLYALQGNSLVEKYVQYGILGIHLWKSEFQEEEIYLRAEYIVQLPISFGEIGALKLSSQNCFRKWVGDKPSEEEGEFVYVTTYGEVYHEKLTCRSIHLSVKAATIEEIPYLRGKNGQRYDECRRCEWKENGIERVYYTDYGTLYHKDIACSAIKRLVEKIKIEDVGNRRPCSFCYE